MHPYFMARGPEQLSYDEARRMVTQNDPDAPCSIALDLPGQLIHVFQREVSFMIQTGEYPAGSWVLQYLQRFKQLVVDGIEGLPALKNQGTPNKRANHQWWHHHYLHDAEKTRPARQTYRRTLVYYCADDIQGPPGLFSPLEDITESSHRWFRDTPLPEKGKLVELFEALSHLSFRGLAQIDESEVTESDLQKLIWFNGASHYINRDFPDYVEAILSHQRAQDSCIEVPLKKHRLILTDNSTMGHARLAEWKTSFSGVLQVDNI